MNTKILSICMSSILAIAFLAVPMTSVMTDATAGDDVSKDYEQYFIDRLTDSVNVESYQNLSADELAMIYWISYQEFASSKHANPNDFIDIYVDATVAYLNGSLTLPEIVSAPADIDKVTVTDLSKGGVTKFESYNWGYRLYLSSVDMNAILGSGLSGAGLVAFFLSLGTGAAVALFLAGIALALIGSYYEYDGIIIEVRTGTPIEIFGYTIVIPQNPPIVTVYPQ